MRPRSHALVSAKQIYRHELRRNIWFVFGVFPSTFDIIPQRILFVNTFFQKNQKNLRDFLEGGADEAVLSAVSLAGNDSDSAKGRFAQSKKHTKCLT